MNKENTIYAAYGSNLNLEQLKFRCPYSKALGNATLPGYQLLFRGGNGGSVATVEPKKGGSVPVLLWDITPRDEEALDRYEGWPRFYRKEYVKVRIGRKKISVMIYIMNNGRPLGSPGEYYLNSIIEGYQSAGFDEKILEQAVRDSAVSKD